MITRAQFLNNPALRRTNAKSLSHDPRRPWLLLDQLRYASRICQLVIVVPRGYRTDFASVPWFFRRIFPQDGEYTLAAVVHDYFCSQRLYDYRIAADVFREAMAALGVHPARVWAMYHAVRLFGPRW